MYFFNEILYPRKEVFIFLSVLFLFISLYSKYSGRVNRSVFFLFLAAFCIFLFAAVADPFLYMWDERFHALVAKNLLLHPLKPTLYDNPLLMMNNERWDMSVIWLHKQPLFLWQMCISYKLFGISEFAVRFPSVLLSSLLVIMFFRSGKILVNENVGYYAAFLLASSNFLFELVSGNLATDHNDVVFLFYVSASIWAWLEFIASGKRRWLILIGLFSGFAILTKWLVGLLVFWGWFLYLILNKHLRKQRSQYFYLLFSLLITCIVVLPWQIYILRNFPVQSSFEYKLNMDHFVRVVEGHQGPWWFYLSSLQYYYGALAIIFIPLGLIVFFMKSGSEISTKIAFISLPVVVYLFYSIAKTKMICFPFVVTMPILIFLGCLIDFVLVRAFRIKFPSLLIKAVSIVFLLLVFFCNIKPLEIDQKHRIPEDKNSCIGNIINNRQIFMRWAKTLPVNSVIFNLRGRSYIDCMFYTPFTAYNFIPDHSQYLELKSKHQKYMIVIVNISREECPEYLKNDPSVVFMKDITSCCDC